MKKSIFFALAAAIALTACDTKPAATEAAQSEAAATPSTGLVYVHVEQVMAECDLYQKEGLPLAEKTQKAQESWAKKERSLQAEAASLQEKYEKGLITTRDAQSKQESLQKRITSFQTNTQKEAATLEEENVVFTNRVQDLIGRAIQAVNAEHNYAMIVNASALLQADTTLNITPAVLAKVNELYAAEKK